MDIIGIVGEYNPFHYGHLYQLCETKKLFSDSAVVCAMPGDFVQRGEAAMFDRFTRAEAACRCGIDLVLELPVRWSLSSAEGFARGAVQLLGYAGCNYISFGSESGNIGDIEKAADLINDRAVIERIKKKMRADRDLSFASARECVLSEYSEPAAELIRTPNNILAVEYVKAIKDLELSIKPITVKRKGNAHDTISTDGLPPASEIRRRFMRGEAVEEYIPPEAWSVYAKAIRSGRVIDRELFDSILLSRLRMFDRDYYNKLPDTSDGLGDRLFRASRECRGTEELFDMAKTKKYAMSRIRRACMCACIGITNDNKADSVPYARVLAANAKGRYILKQMKGNAPVPVITKPAYVNKNDKKCQKVYAEGVSANDLYVLGYTDKNAGFGGQDWKTSPIIVENA